jgi:hypothetical protein
VFRDPSAVKRTATSVNWHPEGNRIAVAYSILKFQDERLMSGRLPPSSFVWDVTYPNHPVRPNHMLECMNSPGRGLQGGLSILCQQA